MPIRNQVYHLTITTRSPIHIASGQKIVKDYDFAYDEKGRVAYLINTDALMPLIEERVQRRQQHLKRRAEEFSSRPNHKQTEPEKNNLRGEIEGFRRLQKQALEGLPLDQLLKERLLSLKDHLQARIIVEGIPLVRYTLEGDLSRSDDVSEQIKDAFDRPYLPGSSIKGALRTVLAWKHFPDMNLEVSLDALQNKQGRQPDKKFADDHYEEALFVSPERGDVRGTSSHRDLLRTLQVSDSSPINVEHLVLAPMSIYGGRTRTRGQQEQFDVLNVEVIPADQVFEATLQIEQYPFLSQEQRARDLNFAPKQEWLLNLAAACRERAAVRLEAEQAYYKERGLPELERFYAALREEARSLGENSFLLHIGWGTGWESKTLDDRLEAHPEEFAEMVQQFDLKYPRSRDFRPGDSFPVTRKLVLNRNQPWRPLGWVRVDMEAQ